MQSISVTGETKEILRKRINELSEKGFKCIEESLSIYLANSQEFYMVNMVKNDKRDEYGNFK